MIRSKPRRIAWLLAAATLVPIGALTWLGLQTLQQDRAVERQRQRERLEVAAGRLALEIERRLQDVEQGLANGDGVQMRSTGLNAGRGLTPLYQPAANTVGRVSTSDLAGAENQEFQRHDLAGAAAAYRRIARFSEAGPRAAALVGLGRVLRQTRDRAGALDAYAELVELGAVPVLDQPSALIGRQGRCKVFEEVSEPDALRREARGSCPDVVRWRLAHRSRNLRSVSRHARAVGSGCARCRWPDEIRSGDSTVAHLARG